MAALDLLGRRWALGVLWELRAGPRTFNEVLRALDGLSPSVLSTRLAELSDARLVEAQRTGGYELTKIGSALGEALVPIEHWSHDWGRELHRASRRAR